MKRIQLINLVTNTIRLHSQFLLFSKKDISELLAINETHQDIMTQLALQ